MTEKNASPLRLCVMHGDGIGPEITTATLGVLRAAAKLWQIEFAFEDVEVGLKPLAAQGTTFPEGAFEAAKAADRVIPGPVSHNDYPPADRGVINPSGALRKRLDLFANIRPAKTREGFPARCGKPVDLVVVRENTEGFYADRNMFSGSGEFMPTADLALAVRKVSREGSMRIAEAGFRLAMQRRKLVTVVHKANVLRVSDGLFLECTRAVAARYAEVKYEEKIIDAMAALLVRDASVFDVIVTTNMFGDILSDEAAEISGSIGLAESINSGADPAMAQAQHGSAPALGERAAIPAATGLAESINSGADHAMAQAQHGSAPDIAGQDKPNPSSLIGSAALLLGMVRARGEHEA